MTRLIIVSLITIFASCAIQAEAAEYRFIAEDHSPITQFCIAAAENDLEGLRHAIRDLRRAPHQKYKTIVNSVRCNGQVAAQFAHAYGAAGTFEYLYKFTEKRYQKMVPVTSVEEVVASGNDAGNPGIVLVHVTGR